MAVKGAFWSMLLSFLTDFSLLLYQKEQGKGKKEKDLSVLFLKSPSTEALGVVGAFCRIDLVFNCRS